MKKLVMLVVGSVLVFAGASGISRAAEKEKGLGLYVGGRAGLLSPDQGRINPGFIGGVEMGVVPSKYFGVSLSWMHYSRSFKGDYETVKNLTLMPVSLTPFAQMSLKEEVNVPITLRAGVGLSYLAVINGAEKASDGKEYDSVLKGNIGWNATLGADYYVTESVSVGVDATYLAVHMKSKTSPRIFDFHSWLITSALKYHFDL